MASQDSNFPDALITDVSVKIKGKEYPLKRFTFGQEIRLKKIAPDHDLQKWQAEFQKLDPDILIKTLHLFMEPTPDFPTTESMLDALDCTLEQKMAIMNAVTCVITAAMPEVQDRLKKKTESALKEYREMVMTQLTGLGSSINSSQPTDGQPPR